MSMNVPPSDNAQDQTIIDNATIAPAQEVAAEQAPVANAEAQAAQEEQVIEGVAQGLAEDTITSEDIIMAMLMDNFGLSPQGAQSLFQLLMTDMVNDAQAPADTTMAVAPQEVTNASEAPIDNTQLPPQGV